MIDSTPAGVEYALATSGLFLFSTVSTLLSVHAAIMATQPAINTARESVIFILIGSSWGVPTARLLADGRYTGSEAGAQLERDAANVREVEIVMALSADEPLAPVEFRQLPDRIPCTWSTCAGCVR